MKKRDIIFAGIFLAAALVLLACNHFSGSTPGTTFVVAIDGLETMRGSLAQNGDFPIRQKDGSVNLISVQDGSVFMKEANCRDGLCVKQGRTNSAAKTIVCLPHKLTVTVNSDPAGPADGLDVIIQ